MDDAHPDLNRGDLAARTREFIARQTSRMPFVGCTPANAPLLEGFYRELLEVLERFVATDRFLFGTRPALGDFGLYAQLKALAVDPTPRKILRESATRTEHRVLRLDDTSGVDGAWASDCTAAIRGLMDRAARYYLPFLAANRRALDTGAERVEPEIDGQPYAQTANRYQAKCYDFLLHAYAALDGEARERLGPLLRNSGYTPFFERPGDTP
jgi:hypothetical protein